MFSTNRFKRMYSRFLGPGGRAVEVTLKLNNGTSWDEHPGIRGRVSSYQESDLVAGGSINVGDLGLIILADSIPESITKMTQKDRVEIDGRDYSVVHWDAHSRTVGDDLIAVEATVRGG